MSSRTINSIRNIFFGFISQGITSILAFINRSIFIYTLGNTYLGLNGLFSDILTLLSLAELGVGTAITYSMYKPVAENNERDVSALLNLYRKIYTIIGIVVTILGLALTPFLSFFISDLPPGLNNLHAIYLLYLLNTSLSYFFVYKQSMLIATQRIDIISKIQIVAILLQNIVQILVLLLFRNFIIYLLVQVVSVVFTNIWISRYVDINYGYIKYYKREKVDESTKNEIFKNIYAMFFSKISSAIVTSTDNILISKYVSTIVLGYYSNYLLFVNLIRQITARVFSALTGSIGNLLALENNERSYDIFKKVLFINFWIIGLFVTMLYILVNPLISIWIGESYKLTQGIVFLICVNLYLRLIRNTCLTFIDTYGLFKEMKWKCVFEAAINLIASLIYLKVFKLGLIGVLIGTFTSNLLTNFWFEPYVLYKKKFKQPLTRYFEIFSKYLFVVLLTGLFTELLCRIDFNEIEFVNLLFKSVISFLTINLCYLLAFYKSDELLYFKSLVFKFKK